MAHVGWMPLAALETGIQWSWETFGEYLGSQEGRLSANAGFLVGHSDALIVGSDIGSSHGVDLPSPYFDQRTRVVNGSIAFQAIPSSCLSRIPAVVIAGRVQASWGAYHLRRVYSSSSNTNGYIEQSIVSTAWRSGHCSREPEIDARTTGLSDVGRQGSAGSKGVPDGTVHRVERYPGRAL